MSEADHARLFLALDLPGRARGQIADWRDAIVSGRDELRPVRDEALHVTLVFLGRTPSHLVDRIWRTAAESLEGKAPSLLAPTGYRTVPPRRPRVLAVDLQDRGERAAAVHLALTAALKEAGLHEPEERPLWPHVTVARVRGRARLRPLEGPAPPPASFTAGMVTLYRSDLHPAGARYVALERLALG